MAKINENNVEGFTLNDVEDRDLDTKGIMEENSLVSMMSPLIADIKDKFNEAERARQNREYQWLRNVNSYRGHDSAEGKFRNSEKSKVFVRTTTVKVKAAYAQIVEALFSDGTFPIDISSTPIPEGTSEYAHLKTDMDVEPQGAKQEDLGAPEGPLAGIGFAGDGFELAPGATANKLEFLGGLKEELSDESGESPLQEGPTRDPNLPQISPAKESARRMKKVILDRLEETKARTEVRKAVFEMCLLGTGVVKGPFNINKTLHKWDTDPDTGESVYMPEEVQTNRSSMVSTWNFYPDPNATTHEEMEWAIERHKMNHAQLRSLKRRPHFDSGAIDRLLIRGFGNYERKSFEHTLDEKLTTESEGRLYEVLEYWGYMDREMLEEFDLPTTEMVDDFVQVNVWVSGNETLRVVVNPFIPQRIPYYVVPYEVDPYSVWGTGVPEAMEDTQALMNGFARLAVDNLALAGSLVFDIDESMLVPGQDFTIEPGKVFRRQMGGAGQAIHGLKFPSTANENMMMFDKFRQLADETTGIPSFAHGQMGVMSPTRTASGMSMLLQNASLNIKTVIRNLDDFLLKPFGEAYFRWEMQFNPDMDIKGDLEVKATGSSSLQAKEVRSQRLNSFLQMAANPALAPLIKLPTVLREFAITMDIDPDEILNSPEEAMIYAAIIGRQNMAAQGAPQAAEQQASAGGVQIPGEPGFTGNTEGGVEPGMEGGELGEPAAAF
jgi:hypothetical protein